jgi:hypothetical protein
VKGYETCGGFVTCGEGVHAHGHAVVEDGERDPHAHGQGTRGPEHCAQQGRQCEHWCGNKRGTDRHERRRRDCVGTDYTMRIYHLFYSTNHDHSKTLDHDFDWIRSLIICLLC